MNNNTSGTKFYLKELDEFKAQLQGPYESFLDCALLLLHCLYIHIPASVFSKYLQIVCDTVLISDRKELLEKSIFIKQHHLCDLLFFDLIYLTQSTIRVKGADILLKTYSWMINVQQYTANINECYPYLVKHLFKNYYTKGSTEYVPDEIVNFVVYYLNKNVIASVYNPFAGNGTFGNGLYERTKYYGQEINMRLNIYARVQLEAFCTKNAQILLGNPLADWEKGPFDAIVANIPWGMKTPANERVETWYLQKASSTSGKLSIGVYPYSILSHIDPNFISRGDIDTIIKLPDNLFVYNPKIKTCIIITNKSHNHFGSIRFIDASSCFVRDNEHVKLDDRALINLCCENKGNLALSKLIRVEEIIKLDGHLEIERFFQKEIQIPQGYHLCALNDIADNIEVRSQEIIEKIPVIKISNLSNNKLEYTLNNQLLEKDSFRSGYVFINETSLLLSRIRALKPTLYINQEGGAFVNGNITALRVDENKVSIPYLISELNKDYVQQQLVFSGITIPSISKKDLMRIQVLIPNSKEFANNRLIQNLQTSISEQAQELSADYEKYKAQAKIELRMRKHAISQVLQDLLIAFDDLKDLRKKNGGVIRDNDIISPLDGSTVANYFDKMGIACMRVDKMVKCLTDENSYGEPEEFLLGEFLEEYKRNHMQHGYSLEIKREFAITDEYELDDETGLENQSKLIHHKGDLIDNYVVSIPKKDLTQVIENILTNARKYGFTENRTDYIVRMEMWEDHIEKERAVALIIQNNGTPLPQGMTPEKVFAWGESSSDGTGIGGWQVKNIIEHFHGQVRLLEFKNPNDLESFTLAYEIKLPIKEDL